MRSNESYMRPPSVPDSRSSPWHKKLRAIDKVRRLLESLSIVVFDRPFKTVPTRLLLDPLLDEYNRGLLLEGRQERRSLLCRWLLGTFACDAATLLSVSGRVRLPSKTWRLAVMVADLSLGWQYRCYRELVLVNAQVGMSVDFVKDHLASTRLSHSNALNIISAYQRSSVPFVLMIRTFDEVTEARVDAKDANEIAKGLMPNRAQSPISLRSFSSEVMAEERFCSALSQWIPVVAIRNSAYQLSDSSTSRLALPADAWEEAIAKLIEVSPYICVHLTELTPGISMELNTIHRLGKEDSTIIVMCEPRDNLGMAAPLFFEALSLAVPEYKTPDPRDIPLRFFDRLVRQGELDYEALASSPEVAAWGRAWMRRLRHI
jgi:hypothetical protein